MNKSVIIAMVSSVFTIAAGSHYSWAQELSGSSLVVSGTAMINTLVSGSSTTDFLSSGTANLNTLGVAGLATLQGGLVLSGTADFLGNILYLGTWTTDPSRPGISISYADATNQPTPSQMVFTATRPSHEWIWEHEKADQTGTVVVMKLDSENRLNLYSPTNSTVPAIVFDPSGTVSLTGNTTVSGALSVSGGSLVLPDGTVLSGSNTLANYMASGTASTISGNISASQVVGLSPVSTTGDFSSLTGIPTIPTDNAQIGNGAGYIVSGGTANNLTISGTTNVAGTVVVVGNIVVSGSNAGLVVTGSSVQIVSGTTTKTKIVSAENRLALVPEQGDLSMGPYVDGTLPQ